MLRFFLFLLGGLFLMYAGVLGFVYFIQRKLQYGPTHRDAAARGHAEFKPFVAKNGTFLGYWRPIENPKRAILLFHGNGGEALDREWIAEVFPEDDYLIVLPEYPGYGAKPGAITEANLFSSAVFVLEEVTARWAGIPVTLIGESLGSGVAAYVASQKKVDRLAMIAPFSSALDVAILHYRFFPVRLMLRDKFDSIQHLSSVKIPLHIIHGTLDDLIPVESGKKLFEAYPGTTKTFSEVPGYGHNNVYSAVTDSPFADKFRAFIRGE